MSRGRVLLLALLLGGPTGALALDSPHQMTLPDGALDTKSCAICHKPDMSLERTPLETCTLCHAEATHSGSLEHIRVAPEAVARVLATRAKDAPKLSLTKEGKIVCITCHLYHDPAVLGESWLATGWVPPDSGFSGGVRKGVLERWAILEKAYDKTKAGLFVTEGTRMLRFPVEDGTLCKQCHGSLW